MAESKWQYAHVYYDEAGDPHRRRVTEAEFNARKPDGHRADGSPYWNYEQFRRQVGPWEPASMHLDTPNGQHQHPDSA